MPSDLPTICEERLRLLRAYSDAATGYSARVDELAALVTAEEEGRAGEASRICRAAGEKAEESRLKLYRHETDHGCGRSASVGNIHEP